MFLLLFPGRRNLFVSLSHKGHDRSHIFSFFQRGHPELARLSRHLEGLSTEFFFECGLVLFQELHENDAVCYEEANELPIVEVAEAPHHWSTGYSFPPQNLPVEGVANLDHLLLIIILHPISTSRSKHRSILVS